MKRKSVKHILEFYAERSAEVKQRAKRKTATPLASWDLQEKLADSEKINKEYFAKASRFNNCREQLTKLCELYRRDDLYIADWQKAEHLVLKLVNARQFHEEGTLDLRGQKYAKRSKDTKGRQVQKLYEALENLVSVIEYTDFDVLGALTFMPPPFYDGPLINDYLDRYKHWETIEDFRISAEKFLSVTERLKTDPVIRRELANKRKKGPPLSRYEDAQTRLLMDLYELITGKAAVRAQSFKDSNTTVKFVTQGLEILEAKTRGVDSRVKRIIAKRGNRKKGARKKMATKD